MRVTLRETSVLDVSQLLRGPGDQPLKWTDARPLMQVIDLLLAATISTAITASTVSTSTRSTLVTHTTTPTTQPPPSPQPPPPFPP